jgi:hypothetical protein
MCSPLGHRLLAANVTPAIRVEKLCSMTLREFQSNLAPLLGSPLAADRTVAMIPEGAGSVTINFQPRPGLRLSGLLTMPLALITLTFENMPPPDQAAFLKRFDLAFQRGGG